MAGAVMVAHWVARWGLLVAGVIALGVIVAAGVQSREHLHGPERGDQPDGVGPARR
jgi:uncharacterized membrane protein